MEKARSWLFSGYAGIPLEITLLSPFWGAKLHSFVMGSSWWAFPGHQVFARGVWLNGRRYGKTLQTPNRNPTYAPIGTVLLIFLCGLLAKSPKYRCGITCWGPNDPIYFYDRWTIPKMQLHQAALMSRQLWGAQLWGSRSHCFFQLGAQNWTNTDSNSSKNRLSPPKWKMTCV